MPLKSPFLKGVLDVSVGAAARGRGMDMTTGPLFHKMLVFALPLVLTNLLQVLYNVADMIVVGRFSPVDGAVGAIGCTGSFINLVTNFVFGVSVGSTVVVSQAVGARDRNGARRGVHTSLMMGVLIGVACLVVGQALCRPMLVLLDTAPEYLAMSEEYCRICFAGLPFTAVLNCALGVMRAQGDSTRPLMILSGAGLLNVALNLLFVLTLGMDVDGVALATVTANVSSAVMALVCLARDRGMCRLRLKRLRIHRATALKVLAVGVPSGLQGMLFSISNIIVQSAVNSFGPATITASSIEVNLHGFVYTAGNAVASAAMTFAGQNMGARKYRRLMPTLLNSYMLVLLLEGILAAVMFAILEPLAGLYMNEATSDREAIFEVLRIAAFYRMLFMPLAGLMDCGALILRGIGRSSLSMVISLIGACGLRIVWIYTVFALFHEQWVLFISYPITWAVTAAVQFLCVWAVSRSLIRKAETPTALQAAR